MTRAVSEQRSAASTLASGRAPGRVITLPTPTRYAVAIAAVAAGTLLRLAFNPLWGMGLPFIFMYPAIMVSAWVGGFWPGVCTTVLSAAAAVYFWFGTPSSLVLNDLAQLLALFIFVVSGIVISRLNEQWRRATAAAIEADEERTRLHAEILMREQTARADVERASQQKDEFLAVLSHELRTPLNAVLGYAHLLGTDALSADTTAHAIAAIRRNAKAQARLVESLLDLSRVMAGKLDLEFEHLEIAKLVESAVDVVRPDAGAKSIALAVVLPPNLAPLNGDGGRLQQVLGNVLSNAVKFTAHGGHVDVHVAQHDGTVSIRIGDTGQGISPAFLPYVFDRFKQADGGKGGSTAGLGLGLALVREMVRAHGGTIVAESPGIGKGSSFTISLPLAASMAAETDTSRGVFADGPIESLPPIDVLIVDDDGDVRDILCLLLESRGARVQTVSSAIDALAAIDRGRPDVLLADVGMPDEDGYSLIRRVRAKEQERQAERLPAIAVTAFATARDRDHALAEGYDGHVAKPVDPDVLAHAIGKLAKKQAV